MPWTSVTFDKHRGKTLPQVVFRDPDWFFWAYDYKKFDGDPKMKSEAERVYRRARAIKIPQTRPVKQEAEYARGPGGKFAGVELVPVDREPHQGSTTTIRLPVFDLNIPRIFCRYDKSGGQMLVRELKYYLFGDMHYPLTKGRCEKFFDDDSKFELVATTAGT